MINFIKKWKEEKQKEKLLLMLIEKNDIFLEQLSVKDAERFFEHFEKLGTINITYSNNIKNHSELNKFYNTFFSRYEAIAIGQSQNIIISYSFIDNLNYYKYTYYHDLLIIGNDSSGSIFVKKNGNNNTIFLESLDDESSFLEESGLYKNIYYYLNDCIGTILEIDLELEYKKL